MGEKSQLFGPSVRISAFQVFENGINPGHVISYYLHRLFTLNISTCSYQTFPPLLQPPRARPQHAAARRLCAAAGPGSPAGPHAAWRGVGQRQKASDWYQKKG